MDFRTKLDKAVTKNNSLVCVGLDPLLQKLPPKFHSSPHPLLDFSKAIIDATADLVCAFKPQIAYYAAQSAEDQLHQILAYLQKHYPHIPTILDAKRGDIGETSKQYAREIFDRYGADAATVNPYMGTDSLQPFLQRKDKGIFILCRTSNPGAEDLQKNCYPQVAELAAKKWNDNHNVALVVGATAPREMKEIRSIVGNDMPLLVPGIGSQGGDLATCMSAGKNPSGRGLLISSSRSIIYADGSKNFAHAARQATTRLRDNINGYR